MYCFEIEAITDWKTNKTITNFAISDYKFTKEIYGVGGAYVAKDLVPSYYNKGSFIVRLSNLDILDIDTATKLSFDKVLDYYNWFTKVVEISKKYNTMIEDNSYIRHCKEYENYYERLVELLQIIIANWNEWN